MENWQLPRCKASLKAPNVHPADPGGVADMDTMITVDQDNYFDVAEALHAWLSLNHEGQWSDTYRLLCRSQFKPGASWSESRVEAENPYFSEITADNALALMEAVEAQLAD
jgi:hypothetical protein